MAENFVDITNKNNHAAAERMEETEKVEKMRREINYYRLEMNQRQMIPTFMVIEWLCKFEKILDDVYAKQIATGEIDRLRQDYFLVAKKKPFMAWGVEELKAKISELQNVDDPFTDGSLRVKKSKYNHEWRKSNAYVSDYLDKKNEDAKTEVIDKPSE